MTQSLRYGTRIEVSGISVDWQRTWEAAKIARYRRENLPKPGNDWHLVQFADGGKLYCHASNLRVVDNRA